MTCYILDKSLFYVTPLLHSFSVCKNTFLSSNSGTFFIENGQNNPSSLLGPYIGVCCFGSERPSPTKRTPSKWTTTKWSSSAKRTTSKWTTTKWSPTKRTTSTKRTSTKWSSSKWSPSKWTSPTKRTTSILIISPLTQ